MTKYPHLGFKIICSVWMFYSIMDMSNDMDYRDYKVRINPPKKLQ